MTKLRKILLASTMGLSAVASIAPAMTMTSNHNVKDTPTDELLKFEKLPVAEQAYLIQTFQAFHDALTAANQGFPSILTTNNVFLNTFQKELMANKVLSYTTTGISYNQFNRDNYWQNLNIWDSASGSLLADEAGIFLQSNSLVEKQEIVDLWALGAIDSQFALIQFPQTSADSLSFFHDDMLNLAFANGFSEAAVQSSLDSANQYYGYGTHSYDYAPTTTANNISLDQFMNMANTTFAANMSSTNGAITIDNSIAYADGSSFNGYEGVSFSNITNKEDSDPVDNFHSFVFANTVNTLTDSTWGNSLTNKVSDQFAIFGDESQTSPNLLLKGGIFFVEGSVNESLTFNS